MYTEYMPSCVCMLAVVACVDLHIILIQIKTEQYLDQSTKISFKKHSLEFSSWHYRVLDGGEVENANPHLGEMLRP